MSVSKEQKKLDFEDIEIRGRMDIEDIVRLQINRCNASAYEPDQTLFESSVMVLLDLLPQHKRREVLARENEYVEQETITVYDRYWCNRPISSSKREERVDMVNFHELYRIVLDAYADSGLTWQIEPELVERGKTPEHPITTKPTPYYGGKIVESTTD